MYGLHHRSHLSIHKHVKYGIYRPCTILHTISVRAIPMSSLNRSECMINQDEGQRPLWTLDICFSGEISVGFILHVVCVPRLDVSSTFVSVLSTLELKNGSIHCNWITSRAYPPSPLLSDKSAFGNSVNDFFSSFFFWSLLPWMFN